MGHLHLGASPLFEERFPVEAVVVETGMAVEVEVGPLAKIETPFGAEVARGMVGAGIGTGTGIGNAIFEIVTGIVTGIESERETGIETSIEDCPIDLKDGRMTDGR